MQPEWYDFEEFDTQDVPCGLFYAAGHYKDDPDYVFVSMFRGDEHGNIYGADIDFCDVTDPKEIQVTHIADVEMPSHPDSPSRAELDTQDLVEKANEYLTANPELCYEATVLIEDLVSKLEV